MVAIASNFVVAVVLLVAFLCLLNLMFVGFAGGRETGCLTVAIFGAMALALATCVFG